MSYSFSQSNHRVERILIKNFSEALFDNSVSPEKVVQDYMIFDIDEKKELQIAVSKAAAHITVIREKVNQDGGWLLPDYKVAKEKEYKIEWFLDFEEISILKLNITAEKKKNVYVLLNSEKNKILQYFYLENNKIRSFSLFVKMNDAWFLSY